MAISIDPSGEEVRALKAIADWHNKKIIEIGCGDGRLTQRLAALGPVQIEAVDPDREAVTAARKNLPVLDRPRVRFHVGRGETLKYKRGTFDVAIFAWSL
jgi:predicted RNA methylase